MVYIQKGKESNDFFGSIAAKNLEPTGYLESVDDIAYLIAALQHAQQNLDQLESDAAGFLEAHQVGESDLDSKLAKYPLMQRVTPKAPTEHPTKVRSATHVEAFHFKPGVRVKVQGIKGKGSGVSAYANESANGREGVIIRRATSDEIAHA